MSTKVESIILCEDVRKEITNKEILIGVYSGNIVVKSYPTMLRLNLWVELLPDSIGERSLHLKVDTPSGNPPIEIDFKMDVNDQITPGAVTIPKLAMNIERDGEIVISFKENDGEWAVVKRKKVMRGVVMSGGLAPN
ncbi:MAG: hypothetical protein H6881_08220 [Rhodobiaceae bacterium]|nr:hypothetical protein [Rhodobiaceae bacterium]MCC0051848.1 hypothetical protein [Rhodobiaceae bacterium]